MLILLKWSVGMMLVVVVFLFLFSFFLVMEGEWGLDSREFEVIWSSRNKETKSLYCQFKVTDNHPRIWVEFIFATENVSTRWPFHPTIVLELESLKKTKPDLKIRGQTADVADQDWKKRICFKFVWITSCWIVFMS